MDVTNIITIDLAEFESSGRIEMRKPGFVQMNEVQNYASKYAAINITDKSVAGIPSGDLAIISTLAYVRSAPFTRTVESFLAFCEKMDENCLGSAEALFDRMKEITTELDGRESPFASLQVARNRNSD